MPTALPCCQLAHLTHHTSPVGPWSHLFFLYRFSLPPTRVKTTQDRIRITSPEHIYASLVTVCFFHHRTTLADLFLRSMHFRLFNKCQLPFPVVNWLTSRIICRLLVPWSRFFLGFSLPPTRVKKTQDRIRITSPGHIYASLVTVSFFIIELRLLICFFGPCISDYLTNANCPSLLSTGSPHTSYVACWVLGHTFFLGFSFAAPPLPDNPGVFFNTAVNSKPKRYLL